MSRVDLPNQPLLHAATGMSTHVYLLAWLGLMRTCLSAELTCADQCTAACSYKYVGAREDVPAGDQGVSPREVGWMYGQYKRLTNQSEGVLTGKG